MADMDIMNFKKPAGQTAMECAQALWAKALRCRPVYGRYLLMGTFIEGFKFSIRQRAQGYFANNRSGSLQELARPHCSLQSTVGQRNARISTVKIRTDNRAHNCTSSNIMNVESASNFESLRLCKRRKTSTSQDPADFRTIGGGTRPMIGRLTVCYRNASRQLL